MVNKYEKECYLKMLESWESYSIKMYLKHLLDFPMYNLATSKSVVVHDFATLGGKIIHKWCNKALFNKNLGSNIF